MHLYLLSGMPGQSKSAAASKIEAYFTNKSLTVGIGSVEAELLKLFPDQREESGLSKDPLVSLIGERPQIEIKNKWPDAYKNAVAQATANNPDIAIVTICFEYYRTETYEFYSPVDGETVRLSKPRTILTLIDDIYEVYYRLSQAGQVFDIRELISHSHRLINALLNLADVGDDKEVVDPFSYSGTVAIETASLGGIAQSFDISEVLGAHDNFEFLSA